MVTSKIKELQALQARAATLQAAIETERNQELASLPGKFGFDSTAAFIQEIAGTLAQRKIELEEAKDLLSKEISISSSLESEKRNILDTIKNFFGME